MKQYGQIDILVNNAAQNPHFGDLMDVRLIEMGLIRNALRRCRRRCGTSSSTRTSRRHFFSRNCACRILRKAAKAASCSSRRSLATRRFQYVVLFRRDLFTTIVTLQAISAYGVTKTTLLGLTKAMATSCAQRNIRVNCIAPGIIKTDFSKAVR